MGQGVVIGLVAALAAAGCGADGSTSVGRAGAPSAQGETRAGLPAVEVHDLAAGGLVRLDLLLPADRPVLVWFWAPY